MPYKSTDDLPNRIKQNLPLHAQEIYLKAFNNAYEEYSNPRKGSENLEKTAHKVAWNAVKKKYQKNNEGSWVER